MADRTYVQHTIPEASGDGENNKDRIAPMQRGVSQLLFNYLPYRTVEWEDGLAIVQLGNVRLSSVWEAGQKTTLLREIASAFERWRARGGTIDKAFPHPLRESEHYTVGVPESIDATVLPAALICQGCGQLLLDRKLQRADHLRCPNCESTRIHQFPFVFVHGCGELIPVQEWIPKTKNSETAGALEVTKHPIRCRQCEKSSNLYIPGRSDRVKDMSIVCRTCDVQVVDRLTARCHRCLKRLARDPEGSRATGQGGTIVSALAMRLARYSASDTYYPQTLSVLRLDRPKLTSTDDNTSALLYKLLPESRRPEAHFSPTESIGALMERLKASEALGDSAETARLLAKIAAIATGSAPPPSFPATGLLESVSEEIEKGIKESLAFRSTVTTVPAIEKAQHDGGISQSLKDDVTRLEAALGVSELLYVEDLPIIAATYGYTRRSFEPTYDELGATNLPVEIRSFPPLQKDAAQRSSRSDLVGTIPVLAREGEHEGIFMSLHPEAVIRWLQSNRVTLPNANLPATARILAALEPIDRDRYYDSIWQHPVRRLVFGLVHSFSHAAMRSLTRYAGVDRTSVAEYIFLPMLGFVVYDSSSSFKLGGVATLVRDHLAAFLQSTADESVECLYDPDCSDYTGACHGCIHSPEISCRVFNHGLSRSFLLGGHAPWSDVSKDRAILGYWETLGTLS